MALYELGSGVFWWPGRLLSVFLSKIKRKAKWRKTGGAWGRCGRERRFDWGPVWRHKEMIRPEIGNWTSVENVDNGWDADNCKLMAVITTVVMAAPMWPSGRPAKMVTVTDAEWRPITEWEVNDVTLMAGRWLHRQLIRRSWWRIMMDAAIFLACKIVNEREDGRIYLRIDALRGVLSKRKVDLFPQRAVINFSRWWIYARRTDRKFRINHIQCFPFKLCAVSSFIQNQHLSNSSAMAKCSTDGISLIKL